MSHPRFNHMELTLPKGELEAHRDEIRAFYLKYLLPIWFDVQAIEHDEQPAKRWSYA